MSVSLSLAGMVTRDQVMTPADWLTAPAVALPLTQVSPSGSASRRLTMTGTTSIRFLSVTVNSASAKDPTVA